ncbi:ABC transporter permease [Streptomyces poonensis]|uniref:Membrane protein n=1 Tax=Streptomyces poonensis TaxID=68255 RepID=A0A918PX59_9ACTN|nr:ABC transporter permease [Streptomyces poonensis]GGZ23999.1 membrane protein [Streptomyces poonensis]GLJ89909.1 membrane protein [Streptomyces poonensis]
MAVEHPPAQTGTHAGGQTVPRAGEQTRIHNIGYRNYDGPRLGRAYARRSLYSQSLRGAYGLGRSAKSKVLPMILFVVMCLPAAIMVAVAVATKMDDLPVDYTRYAVIMQAVIGLYVAAQAPQAVSLDLRFKTIPLYFSRPIETADYVRAKYAALASALFVLTAAPLLVLYVGALLAKLDFTDQTKGFAQGLVSVALLSLLFSGIGLVISAVTPRRGFGVAAVIAALTISYGAVSTLQAIAFDQSSTGAVPWLGLFSPITLIDGVQTAFLGASSAFPGGIGPSSGQGVVFALVTLGAIAGCYGLLMRRYRKAGL